MRMAGKWMFIGAALASAARAQGPAAQPPSPYAIEACAAGCVPLKERGASIYAGVDAASCRLCSRTSLGVEVSVDGAVVRISNRDCTDVNGRAIVLNSGEIVFGRLPR